MKIKKVYNNNVILATDQDDEMILIGRGLAFQKKIGDVIDETLIEKKFTMDKNQTSGKLATLLNEVPIQYVQLADEIIKYAEKELNVKFYDTIYLTLTDHINFALERHKKGIVFKNSLLWDIKRVYEKEYKVALDVLELIEKETFIKLPDDEAGSIAVHFFNAQQEGARIEDSYKIMRIVQDILNIVQYHYKVELDPNSLNFNRFMIHLRFFINSILMDTLEVEDNEFLFEQVKKEYPDAHECVLKIKKYIYQNLGKEIHNNELLYLMVHIQRVTKRK